MRIMMECLASNAPKPKPTGPLSDGPKKPSPTPLGGGDKDKN